MDLNTQYESPFGGAGQQAMAGVQTPPNSLEQLLGLLMPYLLADQKNRATGMNSMVRGLQALRGGGHRDSLTGAIMNPDPLAAQQEHDAYWNSMFTSPAQAIAKERARFDPEGLRPEQKTFTQQGIERMNQTPQQRVNAAMGPGWETMNPQQRRVSLQQMHGQMPDFQDPTGRSSQAVAAAGPSGGGLDEVLAATMAGTPAPTPMQRPQAPQAPQAPMSAAPSPAGPPQASGVSPQFDINQLIKPGPPILPMFGQNTQPAYGTAAPQPQAQPPTPWMYGVGQLRGPMDLTPDMIMPPNYQVAQPRPFRYGVGNLPY